MLQFSPTFEQKPRTVVVVGPEFLPDEPPLLNPSRDGFDPAFFDSDAEADRLLVRDLRGEADWLDPKYRQDGDPPRLGRRHRRLSPPTSATRSRRKESPQIAIDYDSADEQSQITYLRVKEVFAAGKRDRSTAA